MTNEEEIKRLKETQDARVMSLDGIEVDKTETELWRKTVKTAIEALENCPPKEAICYGCHENCKKCEIMAMAML